MTLVDSLLSPYSCSQTITMSTEPRATEIVEQLIREGNIDILEMLTRDDFMS